MQAYALPGEVHAKRILAEAASRDESGGDNGAESGEKDPAGRRYRPRPPPRSSRYQIPMAALA